MSPFNVSPVGCCCGGLELKETYGERGSGTVGYLQNIINHQSIQVILPDAGLNRSKAILPVVRGIEDNLWKVKKGTGGGKRNAEEKDHMTQARCASHCRPPHLHPTSIDGRVSPRQVVKGLLQPISHQINAPRVFSECSQLGPTLTHWQFAWKNPGLPEVSLEIKPEDNVRLSIIHPRSSASYMKCLSKGAC